MNIYGYIGLLCLICAAGLAVFAVYTKKQSKQRRIEGKRNLAFLIVLYARISSIPLLRELLINIRRRLEVYAGSDEITIRKRSVVLLSATVLLYSGLVLLFWVTTRDVFMLLLFMMLLLFIGDTAVEIFINNLQNKLLKQQVYYLEILRNKYYEEKSVEDANYEACNVLNSKGNYEVYSQAEKINDILSSNDVEAELEKYYEIAPNKYLKMLAGILYITKEYGDTKVNGSSVFVRCLSYLGNEIKADLYKRDKMRYALKSLNVISIIPLFFLKPIRNWASKSFAPLENFYTSKAGIVLGIATIAITVIAYMTLRRIQRFDSNTKTSYVNDTIEQKLYMAGLYKLVDRIVPQGYTVKKNRLMELIKNAMAPLNIYTLYTRRLLFGFAAFIFGICLFIGLNSYARHSILYLPQMPQGYLGGKLSEQDLEKLQEIADSDRSVILKLGKHADEAAIKEELKNRGVCDEKELDMAAARIKEKMKKLSSNIFWWWQLLICIILSVAGYNAPVYYLAFLARVRKTDMEEEVSQFRTIILMLMHMNRVHVEEILEWMETFSVHFKEPLQKCLTNFSSDSFEALEELKSDVAFPPFISIIENLQLASEDLGVDRAFEGLENEMEFDMESRKESNERIVEKKKNLGMMLGFLPVYTLIVLYLIIPMIVSGMESISAFYRQLSAI